MGGKIRRAMQCCSVMPGACHELIIVYHSLDIFLMSVFGSSISFCGR